MIKLYTANRTIAKRLDEIKMDYRLIDKMLPLDDVILLCMPEELAELKTSCTQAKVLLLTRTPNFSEGMQLLQKGIKGYGNLYMQKKHLLQAVSTLKNGAVWLYPEMMNELILLGSKATVSEDVLEKLSVREREVAKEIEKGESNKEIASVLGITERTVKAHLSSIYEKLEVGDRLALAMLLRK